MARIIITELAREVLESAELEDLQSLFADEMQMSNSPWIARRLHLAARGPYRRKKAMLNRAIRMRSSTVFIPANCRK